MTAGATRAGAGRSDHSSTQRTATWLLVAVVIVAGVATGLAFAPTRLVPLVVLGPAAALATLAHADSARRGALLGLAYGLAYAMVVLRWTIDLHVGMFIALPTVIALWFLLFGAIAGRLAAVLRPAWWVVAVTAVWLLVDAGRARVPLSGVEWGQLGVATADVPLRRASAIVGTLGLSALLVAVAAGLALLVTRGWRHWGTLAVCVALLLVVTGLGSVQWTSADGSRRVAVVQVDDPCPDAFAVDCPGYGQRLVDAFVQATGDLPGGEDLVVWGESALGGDPAVAGEAVARALRGLPAPLLAGTATAASPKTLWNRNVLYAADGTVLDAYAKRKPVPFGEYVPWRDVLGGIADVGRLVPRDLLAGDEADPITVPTDSGPPLRVGSVVSWEISFSRLVRDVAADADLLATLTTVSSYGSSPVSDQMLAIAQLRAAELQKPVVVAATTGRSAVIDATGVQRQTTGLYVADTLIEDVELRSGLTPYARAGEVSVVLLAVGALVLALWRGRMREQTERSRELPRALAGTASET